MVSRVLLVEDHHVVREALRSLLSVEIGIEVIGEAARGEEAVRLVRKMHPDLVVVDLMLPGMTGFEVIRELQSARPRPRIVVLSMYADAAYVLEALRSGASGYVLKQAPAGELVRGLRVVLGGGRYLSPPLSEETLAGYAELSDGRARPGAGSTTARLSGREREVVRLVALGQSNAQIAEALHISQRTVEGHRARAMRKLHLHKHADLVRYALTSGLVPHDSAPDGSVCGCRAWISAPSPATSRRDGIPLPLL
jgi:DNA-binding NarL/FixJ family response regulator